MGLTLVSNFTRTAYPHRREHYLINPDSADEICTARKSFADLAESLGIADYKVLDGYGVVTLHLSNAEDLDLVSDALSSRAPVEEVIACYDEDADFRRVKNGRNVLERHVRQHGIFDVDITANRTDKTLVVCAPDHESFERFYEAMHSAKRFLPEIRNLNFS